MRRVPAIVAAACALSFVLTHAGLTGCVPGGGVGGAGLLFNLPPVPVITSDVVRGVTPLAVRFGSDGSTDDGLIVAREWDFGDGTTSQDISPAHTFTATGDFTVTLLLTDDQGAQASRTLVISATEAPVARISADPTAADAAPALIRFDASTSFDPDGTIEQYQWDFGDGSRELIATVDHTYATPGTFRAKLTVTDDKGVTGSAEIMIAIGIRTPNIEFRIPPANVSNLVASSGSPLWVQAVYDLEPGVPRTIRAGLDGDRDICQAKTVLYNLDDGTESVTLSGHGDRVTSGAFTPDGTAVLTASHDGTLRLYSAATGTQVVRYQGSGTVTSLAFAPDGASFVYGQSDGNVVIRDFAGGNVVREYGGHTAGVNAVAFSSSGDQIISGGSDRRAILWNVADGTILRDFQHQLAVNAVAINPADPTMVATGSADSTIKLWSVTSGAELATLTGHSQAVNALAFSSDGFTLLSGSDDGSAKTWSPFVAPYLVRSFEGHIGGVTAVAFSPDGSQLITGSADTTARVWNSATGELLRTLQPCVSTVSAVAIAPDGATALVGVAARNDIQLDTDPPNGNDLNLNVPAALVLSDVPTGQYFLWTEIDPDRTPAVRRYSDVLVTVVDPFTSTVAPETPVIPLMAAPNDPDTVHASVLVAPTDERQIFDLGPLELGDRIFISLLSTPNYGRVFDINEEFSVMILDANQNIYAWYQQLANAAGTGVDRFVLFTPNSKLIVGHSSPHYYVVTDGGESIHVRIKKGFTLGTATRQQRVYVRFDGGSGVTAGDLPPMIIPALDAGDFNQFFASSPGWGQNETEVLKTVIIATLKNAYAGYNIVFVSSDEEQPPTLPFQTMYVGGEEAIGFLYGIADYIDPRNETATGTGITFATAIARDGIAGLLTNSVSDINALGGAIGMVAAHEVGHLLGLRHTDTSGDLMQSAGDPSVGGSFRSSLVTALEQVGDLEPIGIQNAPQLLQETLGVGSP